MSGIPNRPRERDWGVVYSDTSEFVSFTPPQGSTFAETVEYIGISNMRDEHRDVTIVLTENANRVDFISSMPQEIKDLIDPRVLYWRWINMGSRQDELAVTNERLKVLGEFFCGASNRSFFLRECRVDYRPPTMAEIDAQIQAFVAGFGASGNVIDPETNPVVIKLRAIIKEFDENPRAPIDMQDPILLNNIDKPIIVTSTWTENGNTNVTKHVFDAEGLLAWALRRLEARAEVNNPLTRVVITASDLVKAPDNLDEIKAAINDSTGADPTTRPKRPSV